MYTNLICSYSLLTAPKITYVTFYLKKISLIKIRLLALPCDFGTVWPLLIRFLVQAQCIQCKGWRCSGVKTGIIPHKAIKLSPWITLSKVFVTMTPGFSHDVTKLLKWKIRWKLDAVAFRSEEEVSWRRRPPWPFLPRPGSAPWWIWSKNNNICKGPWFLYPYQVSSKSIKRLWRRSWKFGKFTDVRTTDDGRCAMTIAHSSLRFKWAQTHLLVFDESMPTTCVSDEN